MALAGGLTSTSSCIFVDKRVYPGRLSFLPVEPYVPKKLPNAQKEVSRQTNDKQGNSDEKEADNIENNTENP